VGTKIFGGPMAIVNRHQMDDDPSRLRQSKRTRLIEAGFTLIEVSIAVVILAAAVTTLYGLQAANTRSTLHIANENQATLLVRQFFAMMDARSTNLPPIAEQVVEGTVEDIYRGIGVTPPLLSEDARVRFRAKLVVDQWPLAALLKSPMKRMQVTISWGPTDSDRLLLTYFLPPVQS
jgi:prepilin-type N-terminal cleavage/methylation domain-containing protein